jgi:hypothetical protein
MGKLIELPSKKVCDYYEIRGAPTRWGWFVRHVYVDGSHQDFDFPFEQAEDLVKHLRSITADRLA